MWYTALHTHDGVFGSSQLLPLHSWMEFAVCYEKCLSCELPVLPVLQFWMKWHVRIVRSSAWSIHQCNNQMHAMFILYMHLHLKVLKLSIIRSCSSYIISDGCEALTLVFCGNKQILLYLLSGHSQWCYLLVVAYSTW